MRVTALPFDLWDSGYKSVVSIDYSKVVIDIMKEKAAAKGTPLSARAMLACVRPCSHSGACLHALSSERGPVAKPGVEGDVSVDTLVAP